MYIAFKNEVVFKITVGKVGDCWCKIKNHGQLILYNSWFKKHRDIES